jgi:steroid delta-isomerase-like uncharacterized protein
MTADDNKALVRGFIDAVNRGDYAALRDIVAPDFVRHCQATPEVQVRSRADFVEFDRSSRQSFPDQEITLQRAVAEGDAVAVWCRYRGTQAGAMGPFPPSGRQVDLDFAGHFRVAHGRLAELWVTWDNLTMLRQLGHFPAAS